MFPCHYFFLDNRPVSKLILTMEDDFKDSLFAFQLCPYSSKSKASLKSHVITLHEINNSE